MTPEQAKAAVQELTHIPGKLEQILTHDEACDELAKTYVRAQDFLFLGRGIHYPIALEGALKLKEISYIHAEGYPAGEMKHGPNALIDENLPVVIIATRDVTSPQSMTPLRKNHVEPERSQSAFRHRHRLATDGDKEIAEEADHVLFVPRPRKNCRQFLRSSRCNCSPITSPCAAAAT
jgi:glucosamine--fructose-6-phosphate aminotransferase (isomerizing)